MEIEIEEFKNYLMFERRYSPHTVKAYCIDLEEYADYCQKNYQVNSLGEVEQKKIRQWLMTLRMEGLNVVSINRKISAIRSFYKWMLRNDMILRSPALGLRNLKKPRKLPEFVPADKMEQMLDGNLFDGSNFGERDKLIIELFYDTGIRETELINIKCRDLDPARLTLNIKGKGGKTRMVPISEQLCKRLLSIITEPDNYLFRTPKGAKMYPKLVYRIVHKYLEQTNAVSQNSPHTLRHSFATAMLNNGAPLEAIKELLGHANLSATQIYTHTSYEKLNKIYKQAHPRA